jgi:hypothetical protein
MSGAWHRRKGKQVLLTRWAANRHGLGGGVAMIQLDMFALVDPLVGIEVNFERHCLCGHDLHHLGPGSGPHRASLHCSSCGRHCGWLSHQVAKFLSDVIEHFGRPTEPVCVREPPRATAEQVVVHSEQ